MPSMSSTRDFQHQSAVAPLNDKAQQFLAQLVDDQASVRTLTENINKVVKALTDSAAQINDRRTEDRLRHAKKIARLREEGEEEPNDEQRDYEAFQDKVDTLTEKMDHSIRKLLDDQNWVQSLPGSLRSVAVKTGAVAAETQTQGPTPLPTQRPRRVVGDDDDEELEDEEEEPEAPAVTPFDVSNAPSNLFETTIQKQLSTWTAKSVTDRYANTNEYTGFYRTVYDAKNPEEDAPPVPHASLWFAVEEGRDHDLARSTQQGDGEDDEDFAMAMGRIRYKCPITMAPFKDPVTSTKCPHSFEKTAFNDMLRVTSDQLPWTDEQAAFLASLPNEDRPAVEARIRTPALSCPECSVLLLTSDVEPNPILLRKVKRIQEAIRKQAEKEAAEQVDVDADADQDEELVRETQESVGLDSSPPKISNGKIPVKKERKRSSTTPAFPSRSQGNKRRGTMADEDDEDEDSF